MNGAERREFVRNHRTCVFGYGRKAHGPSMPCVYYVMNGDDIVSIFDAQPCKAEGGEAGWKSFAMRSR